MSDLLYRLVNEPPIQTHGPLPPSGQFIPFLVPDRRPDALPGYDYIRPKHAGSFMSEVHQPPTYRPPVAAPYHTAEHAPDEYYDMVESGDITPEMQTQMYRDAAHGM